MNELERIKHSGMYGHYVFDDAGNLVDEVKDGKCFDQETFENEVARSDPRYHVYFLPDQVRKVVRREWSKRTRAELDQRINKLRFIQKQEKNKFLLRHKVELDELLQIQEIDRASIIIEGYCKAADPVERYQEFFRIDDLRKKISRFIRKAEERPVIHKMQKNGVTQCLLEFNNY